MTEDQIIESLASEFSEDFAVQAFACLLKYPNRFNLATIDRTTFIDGSNLDSLADVAITHHRRYGVMPAIGIIEDEAVRNVRSLSTLSEEKKDERVASVRSKLDDVRNAHTEDGDAQYVLERIGSWVQRNRTLLALKEYFGAIKDGKTAEELRKAKIKLSEIMSSSVSSLFQVETFGEMVEADIPEPKEAVEGIMDMGDILLFGGASKSRKTWVVTDLAVSLATGLPWMNRQTICGRVLYLNFELKRFNMRERVSQVIQAKTGDKSEELIAKAMKNLEIVNLRGKRLDPEEILANLEFLMRNNNYVAYIIDPVYMFLNGREENSNEMILEMLAGFAVLCEKTGALGVLTHHFSKGNKAETDLLDRFSGAGAFGRFIDGATTLLPLDETQPKHSYKVEMVLRNKADVEPFGVTWVHPLMVPDKGLDLSKVKSARGRREKYPLAGFLSVFKDKETVTRKEWYEHMDTVYPGIGKTTLKDKILELVKAGKGKGRGDDMFVLAIDSATKGTPANFKEREEPTKQVRVKNGFSAALAALGG